MSAAPEEPTISRRSVLDWVIGFCGMVFSAATVIPALAYLWPAAQAGPIKVREEVGDAATWSLWEARKVSVAGKAVIAIKTDKGFVAYSAICTHLGCLVEFDSAKHDIICPCHAATFDLEGNVTGGPPPRPLAPYKISEVQGKVIVST